ADLEGLKKLTGTEFTEATDEQEPARAVAEMDAAEPSVPSAEGESGAAAAGDTSDALAASDPVKANTGDDDPIAFAAPGSPLGAIATARAAGIEVKWLPIGDARATSESIGAARGDRALIGLGDVFGDGEKFAKSAEL